MKERNAGALGDLAMVVREQDEGKRLVDTHGDFVDVTDGLSFKLNSFLALGDFDPRVRADILG